MRKLLYLGLASALSLALLASCGSPAAVNGESSAPSAPPETEFAALLGSEAYHRRYPLDLESGWLYYSERTANNAMPVLDAEGNPIAHIAVDLWFAANEVYNVGDDAMFEMGDASDLLGGGPEFYELMNYDAVVQSIFTENGLLQLEQTMLGSPNDTFIQKRGEQVYRLGPWKTGTSYARTLYFMAPTAVSDSAVTLTVLYEMPGRGFDYTSEFNYVPVYGSADFTIAKADGVWRVDSYVYPESYPAP